MACSNGSEKKPGVSDYGFLSVADSICALYGEESPMCNLARFGFA